MRVDIEEVPNACAYCRKLIKQPNYPKTIYLYRGDMLCLTVDVEKASKLRLDENTLLYEKYDEVEARRLLNLPKKQVGSPQGDV